MSNIGYFIMIGGASILVMVVFVIIMAGFWTTWDFITKDEGG